MGWTYKEVLETPLRILKRLRGERWIECPPLDRVMAAFAGYKAPAGFGERDADFDEATKVNADWFADPARFFH